MWIFLLESLLSETVLSMIGLVVGKFIITVENDGWTSRQMIIASRDMQRTMLMDNQILYPLPHNHAMETENDSGNGYIDCCIFLGIYTRFKSILRLLITSPFP